MRISVITQYYKPEMGAPQNRLYEMCVGLKNLGADVSVITAMPNYPTGSIFPEYKGKCSCQENLDGIEILRYWLYASNSRKALPRIWSMISFSVMVLGALRYLRRRKNDFIIVESPPLTLAVSALLLAKLTGARLIMNVSDLWPLSAKELGAISGDGVTYKVLAWLEQFLYKHSAVCIGQSQEIVDYMAAHGANATYLFRNGVAPERFDGIKHQQRTNKLRIVYTGLLGYAQGILGICEHVDFAKLDAEFHIYGAGGEQQAIETYMAAHPDKGITFHGKVAREQIPSVLALYDCTLIPLVKNIYGAVPSKIYESMAAGLPIIFSGEGEGAHIIQENRLGWVSSALDYEALATNIKEASTNTKAYMESAANCVACAQNKFNRPKQINGLYTYLSQI